MEPESGQLIENDIEKLKAKLEQFCEEQQVEKFEADEIIELLEDGEAVEWIAEQLFSPDATDKIAALEEILTPIQIIVQPEKAEEEELETEEEIVTEDEEEEEPDLSALLAGGLPDGMNLPPGFDMSQVQKLMEGPKGQFMTDFSLFCQEKEIDMTDMGAAMQNQIKDLQQEWLATPREAFEGKTPQEMIDENPELALPQKVETVRREEPKVGRNDPCPCGSGKKYKKCCGRGK